MNGQPTDPIGRGPFLLLRKDGNARKPRFGIHPQVPTTIVAGAITFQSLIKIFQFRQGSNRITYISHHFISGPLFFSFSLHILIPPSPPSLAGSRVARC